jgi:hypothetical protein
MKAKWWEKEKTPDKAARFTDFQGRRLTGLVHQMVCQ